MLSDSTQVRTVVKIADELDVCPIVLFKFILLSKEHKLKILEQIKQALIERDEREEREERDERDEREDAHRHY